MKQLSFFTISKKKKAKSKNRGPNCFQKPKTEGMKEEGARREQCCWHAPRFNRTLESSLWTPCPADTVRQPRRGHERARQASANSRARQGHRHAQSGGGSGPRNPQKSSSNSLYRIRPIYEVKAISLQPPRWKPFLGWRPLHPEGVARQQSCQTWATATLCQPQREPAPWWRHSEPTQIAPRYSLSY